MKTMLITPTQSRPKSDGLYISPHDASHFSHNKSSGRHNEKRSPHRMHSELDRMLVSDFLRMAGFFGCTIPTKAAATSPGIDHSAAVELFNILKPKHSPYPLIRIGGETDGSYLVPNDLGGISGCLSPGVNNFKHFEDELAWNYGIASDLIDASSNEEAFSTPIIHEMQTFQKKWLDISGEENCVSISEWLASKPSEQQDFILQIDIEGAEYRNILATPSIDLSRFRIIIMELHRLPVGFCRPQVFHYVMTPFLKKLDELYVCVHAHPNNVIGVYTPPAIGVALPRILELTFLRKDRFPPGVLDQGSHVSLPHSLDITNVISRPPLHLSKDWLTGPRSLDSNIRMSSDWINYYKYHKSKDNLKNLVKGQAKIQLKRLLSQQNQLKQESRRLRSHAP